MDKLTAVTLIMSAAFASQVAISYFRTRPESRKTDERLAKENAELKARVATLEALVTDPGYELKQKISRL
ncbi:hypothetical protein [Shewanella sp.]|uniref:hypothetical protein n=1 Tax=Shewanella sp. TaxID=50422 RepID=UPI003567954E